MKREKMAARLKRSWRRGALCAQLGVEKTEREMAVNSVVDEERLRWPGCCRLRWACRFHAR